MDISIDLEKYISEHSSQEMPILNKIYRETNIKYLNPRMVTGHNMGLLLMMISKMIRPKHILEIGTFTGYSTICLAQGLVDEGYVYTIEINDEIISMAEKYFSEAGLDAKINIYKGDAIQIVPTFDIQFDIIFIDGEKSEYPDYLDVTLPKLKKGGFLIADNVLWSGKVLNLKKNKDKTTLSVHKFNEMIKKENRLAKVLLPLRDGLMICQKIE